MVWCRAQDMCLHTIRLLFLSSVLSDLIWTIQIWCPFRNALNRKFAKNWKHEGALDRLLQFVAICCQSYTSTNPPSKCNHVLKWFNRSAVSELYTLECVRYTQCYSTRWSHCYWIVPLCASIVKTYKRVQFKSKQNIANVKWMLECW